MNIMELQNTAESVLNLEARITNWIGDISHWFKELTQLHKNLEKMLDCVLEDCDPIENKFLKRLLQITEHCEEIVFKRACIGDPAIIPGAHFTPGYQKQCIPFEWYL